MRWEEAGMISRFADISAWEIINDFFVDKRFALIKKYFLQQNTIWKVENLWRSRIKYESKLQLKWIHSEFKLQSESIVNQEWAKNQFWI